MGLSYMLKYKIKSFFFQNYAYEKRESLYYNLYPCQVTNITVWGRHSLKCLLFSAWLECTRVKVPQNKGLVCLVH